METVGIYLKREREANNISLRDVAQATKITSIYLEHIEKNEFDKIPQGPYIKGYLSSYSRAIGCDVDKTINLYESANRKQTQDEAIQSASAPIDGWKHSAEKYETKRKKKLSRLRLGDLSSCFNSFVAFVVAKVGSLKTPKKPINITAASEPNDRKPFRKRVWRVRQSGRNVPSHNRSNDRKIWLYACVALFGAFILFFSGIGFYHLFLYDPDSVTVDEAKTTSETKKILLPSVGSQTSIVTSPSNDVTGITDRPKDYVPNKQLSEPAKAEVLVSDAKPEADISSGMSSHTTKVGQPSLESSSMAQTKALIHDKADVKSTKQSGRKTIRKDLLSKPTIIGAALKVSEAATCRAIENRIPAGVDRVFTSSAGMIYVWTKIEATQVPSKIHHIYYLDGKQISDVSLDVRSAHWRTWSYQTIANHRYRGEWRVDIATSNGEILRQLYFEVK